MLMNARFCGMMTLLDAPIAQLVEQLPFKETVVGSNPTGRTAKTKTGPRAGFGFIPEV